MIEYTKYPRTMNLPWSESNSSDDVWLKNCNHFIGKEVVVTEKMDGECLHEGTLLDTNKGKAKIEDICNNVNDFQILGMNLDTQKIEYQKISNVIINDSEKEWFEIEIENGITIKLTGDHLVWLPKLNCYRRVDQLKIDDEFLLKN